ncbi:MAG: O-antigen ligase family protein [Chloroflexi bacterium]|nr:O-antigen ligase family protein [Chloroflexota bacterium]
MSEQAPAAQELNRGEGLLLRVFHAFKALALAGIYAAAGFVTAKAITSDELNWLTAVVAIGLCVVIVMFSPLAALLGWLVVSPYAPFFGLNIHLGAGVPDLSLDRMAVAAMLALMAGQVVLGRRRLAPFTRTDALILVFCLGYGVSGIVSTLGWVTAYQALFDAVYTPILVYFIAKNLVRSRRDLYMVIGALAIIGAYLAVLTIREQTTGEVLFALQGRSVYYTEHIRRVAGLLGNPAFTDVIIAMTLPLLLVAVSRIRSLPLRLLGWALAGMLAVGVYMTFVRAGWVALALGMLVLAVLWPRFRLPFALLLVVGAGLAYLNWEAITSSYVYTERLTFTKSIDYRSMGMDLAIRVFQRYPILGVGFANFGSIAASEFGWHPERWVAPSPHNSYLYIAVSGGLLALAPYLLMFLSIVWDGWRVYWRGRRDVTVDRPMAAAFLAAMAAYLAPIFTMEIEASKLTNLLFYLIVGGMLGLWLHEEQPGAVRRIREETTY